jgi:anti-sigma factor RsiW
MNCRTTRKQFDERLDDRLTPAARARFDAHLRDCADCCREWEGYAAAWRLLAQHAEIEPSFGFVERTMRRLDAEPEPARVGWRWPLLRWAAIGCAVVAVGLAGWIGLQRLHQPAQPEVFAQIHHGDFFEDLEVIASLGMLESTPDL